MKSFKNRTKIILQNGECFYGGIVRHGTVSPYTFSSEINNQLSDTIEGDTFGGIFVSNKGRYIRIFNGDCRYEIKNGEITIDYDGELCLGEGYGTLKAAYAAVYAASQKDSVKPPEFLLTEPQFCTWTEMDVNVTQEKIIEYVNKVVDYGFPHGIFIIDDGWMTEYGDWTFDKKKFGDPAAMVEILHKLGFKVSMWLVPFINEGAKDFSLLKEHRGLVLNPDGSIYKRKWWNGESALLDMTSPFTVKWLKSALDKLMSDHGVDGFKFDGGGTRFYLGDRQYYSQTDCVGQSMAWAEFALGYEISELKEYCYFPFRHVITRLNDKRRIWDEKEGIGSLVPNMINAGLCGALYTCADMIGGGQISDFRFRANEVDEEVIMRFCECSALMPCMQFSHAYWNKNEKIGKHFLKFAALHEEFKPYLQKLIVEAENFGIPILRSLEYEFPMSGFENETRSFMLGSEYLVSPVTEKGAVKKELVLPAGYSWIYVPTGKVYTGGRKVVVDAPVGVLPYFKKTKNYETK